MSRAGAFHLSRLGPTKRSLWAGSIALILAIGVSGVGVGRQASAQGADPQKLIDLLKKKKANRVTEEGQRREYPRSFRGRRDDTRTAVTPENVPGNTPR